MAETADNLAFWAPDLEDNERAHRMVKSQQVIANLGSESYRRDKDLFNVRLYENNPVITLYDFAGRYYTEQLTVQAPAHEVSTNNRAKAAIDTLAAQIASTDTRARCLSVDANYQQRRRARELQNFSDGLAYDLKLHKHKQRAFKDAAILESGVGVLQFFRRDGRCAVQRRLATEFSIDPRDGLVDGEFRTIYSRRPMPRDRIKADFAEKDGGPIARAIDAAPRVAAGGAPGDFIEVFEAWTLPTGEGTDDGWHVIALAKDGGALLVEQYTKPHHELVFFSIEERFTTGWGLSLMTQCRQLQIRINANSYRSDRITKLFAAGHLYLNKAARIEKSKLTNEIGSVWEGNLPAGEAMSVIQFSGMTADLEAKIERDGQRIFENLGINLHASQGLTNTGLDSSGAAKREEKATADERNGVRQQRWEQFHLDCMRAAIGVVRDIVTGNAKPGKGYRADRSNSYKVAAPGKRGMTVTDWRDVAMDEKDFVLLVKPASPLPTDPEGLIAQGSELVDRGVWPAQKLAGMIQDLDLDGRMDRQLSQERGLEKTFEKLLYDKVAAAMPTKYTNLALALEIGTEYLAQGDEDGVPEKHLERVRRYLDKVVKMQTPKAPPAAPAVPGAAPSPPGPPQLASVPPAA